MVCTVLSYTKSLSVYRYVCMYGSNDLFDQAYIIHNTYTVDRLYLLVPYSEELICEMDGSSQKPPGSHLRIPILLEREVTYYMFLGV